MAEPNPGNVFSQEQLHTTVNRHAALTPEEFFARVLNDIRPISRSTTLSMTMFALSKYKSSILGERPLLWSAGCQFGLD